MESAVFLLLNLAIFGTSILLGMREVRRRSQSALEVSVIGADIRKTQSRQADQH